MPAHRLIAAVSFFVVLAPSALAPAQVPAPKKYTPPAVNLPVPLNDADLDAAVSLAEKMKSTAAGCKACKSRGGDVDCQGANATSKSADALRVNLMTMLLATHAAAADDIANMKQIDLNMKVDAIYSQEMRDNYLIKKTLVDISKVIGDLASIADSAEGLKELAKAARPEDVLSGEGEIAAKYAKDLDTAWEAASGAASAAEDAANARAADPGGAQGVLPGSLPDVLTAKGGVSDLANAISNFKKYSAAAKTATTAAQAAEATKAARAGAKNIANIALKIAQKYEDNELQNMLDQIAEDKRVSNAMDANMQSIIADLRRLSHREAALQKAIDAARDAASNAYACAAKCGAAPPAPIPQDAGTSWGATLKTLNSELSGLIAASVADTIACKEKPKPPAVKTPPKTTTGTSAPAAPKKCAKAGGLAGAINNEACQIQNSGK